LLIQVGQRRALRRTHGPPPDRRETPLQREALPHFGLTFLDL
jgi:hypothetical protein